MLYEKKQLLIVDDSEIDREILKSVLEDDFDIIEAENGYSALEIIMKKKARIDAMLLDVSMPVLDGFSVLQFLKENNADKFPVFLITAEATKDNVEKAVQYNISEFIGKPFDREDIIKRLRSKLGVIAAHHLTRKDIQETNRYISDLEEFYNRYLTISGEDGQHYRRVAEVMKILLKTYAMADGFVEIGDSEIDIIGKAAYFYDIGNMLIFNNTKFRPSKQDESGGDVSQSHALLGADLVRLNYSEHCAYFVQICSDMCEHHHERYDGTGFPHRIFGNNLSVYTQMCRLADEFDNLFYKYREHSDLQFEYVINELSQDQGIVSEKIFSLLKESRYNILIYYQKDISLTL